MGKSLTSFTGNAFTPDRFAYVETDELYPEEIAFMLSILEEN